MSGSPIVVKVGPPRQLNGASWESGSSVYNGNATNAVWLSTAGSVTPGNGIKVPPLGSVTWTGKGIPYGCVDTGVLTDVIITVSDDANQLTDPVGTGLAIAQQLLLTGVPNVLVQTQFQVLVPANSGSQAVDISGYASLILQPQATAVIVDCDIFQIAGAGLSEVVSEMNKYYWDPNYTMPATRWEAGVSGATLTITNNTANTITFDCIGSNRAIAKPLSGRYLDTQGYHGQVNVGSAGVFQFPQAQVSGTPVKLEGQCLARYAITGGATSRGSLQLVNQLGTFTLIDATEMNTSGAAGVVSKMIALPVGSFDLRANVSTFAAAGVAILDLIPIG